MLSNRLLLSIVTAAACLFGGQAGGLFAQTTWNVDADGPWHTAANWDPAVVPNSADASALLGGIITDDRIIRLGANVKVGDLTISNPNSYQISGFYELQFQTLGGASAMLTVEGGGSPSVTAGLFLFNHLIVDQSSAGVLTLGGTIRATPRSVTKIGTGTIELTGNNSFGGGLFINEGTVRAYSEAALGNGGNVTLNGGILNFGANVTSGTDLNRVYTMGASGGTLDIDGGMTLTLGKNNLLAGSGTLTKDGSGRLVLGGDNSSSFSGAISIVNGVLSVSADNNFGSGTSVTLDGGALNVSAGFTAGATRDFSIGSSGGTLDIDYNQTLTLGLLSGSGDLTKDGRGTLAFSGNSSTFSGGITIQDGTMRVSMADNPGAGVSSVTLAGGTLNVGGNLTVPSGIPINIGSGGGTLDIDSGGTLTLGGAGQVNGANTLTKAGAGILAITGNQNATWSGSVVISDGTLSFSGANGSATGVTGFTVGPGGTLLLDNSASANANRIGDSAGLTLEGGKFRFVAAAGGTESVGTLTLAGGASTVEIQRPSSSAVLTLSGLARTSDSATVHFANTGDGTLGNTGNNPRIIFTSAPTLENSLIGGWATAVAGSGGGLEFATYGANGVQALTSYETRNQNQWNATRNARPNSNQTLNQDRDTYSLNLASGIDVNLNGRTLNVVSGGLIKSGASASTISGAGLLTAGTSGVGGTLFTHVESGATLAISSVIGDNGGGQVNLVKANLGTLLLSGANSYSGSTFINEGTLRLGAADSIPTGSAVSVASGATFDLASFNQTVASLSGGGSVQLGSATLRVGGASSTTFAGAIGGTGGLTQDGTGVLTLTGVSTYTGDTTLNSGTVRVSQAANLGASTGQVVFDGGTLNVTDSFAVGGAKTFTLNGAGTIDVNSGSTLTLPQADNLTGSGNLTKAGSGTLILGGSSGYTGNLVIDGGELKVAGTSAAVNTLLTGSRISNLSGAGGTLTWAVSGAVTNTVTAHPGSPSNIKIGFDAQDRDTWYVLGPADKNLNWAGLVVEGGTVQLGYDHTLVGNGATTLEMKGGTLLLAGSDPVGAKTLEISGTATLDGGILNGGPGGGSRGILKVGGDIISSGTILASGPSIVMVAETPGTINRLTGTTPLNGVSAFTKEGPGTVVLEQSMTVSGALTISQGTLLLGASDRLNDNASIVLAGGTFATGGHSETVGSLTLLQNSTIDMGGTQNGFLAFADSSAMTWGGTTLTIENYYEGADRIYFGTTSDGLTSGQLSQIRWVDPFGAGSGVHYGALIGADGRLEVQPIPEPSTVIAIFLLVVAVGWRERKHLKALIPMLAGMGLWPSKKT